MAKVLEGTVDISNKKESKRVARAQAVIKLDKKIINLIKEKKIIKGDAIEQARVAGIIAAKNTSQLIPLTHPIRLSNIKISFLFSEDEIKIISEVIAIDRTGVEMEALVSCVIAALTIYDMCKMYSLSIQITDIMLLEKRGGKSSFKRLNS